MAKALNGRLLLFGLFRGLPFASLNSLLSVHLFPTTDCALVVANFEQGENFAMTESSARSLIEASSAG